MSSNSGRDDQGAVARQDVLGEIVQAGFNAAVTVALAMMAETVLA